MYCDLGQIGFANLFNGRVSRSPKHGRVMAAGQVQSCRVPALWLHLLVSFVAAMLTIASAAAATTNKLGERKALVIGNSNYLHVDDLPGAAHDARDISAALQQLGFKTHLVENATASQLTAAFEDLVRTSTKEDSVFIFYSGHGFQVGNDNYLAPIDLDPVNTGFKNQFNLSKFLPLLINVSKVRVLFLDACRNDPNKDSKSDTSGGERQIAQQLASSLSRPKADAGASRTVVTRAIETRSLAGYSNGFGRMRSTEPGTFLAYSTASGQYAVDRLEGSRNSPFTTSVLKYIGQPGLDLPNLITKVRNEVYLATASLAQEEGSSQQLPWSQSSLVRPFFFVDKSREEWLAKQLQTMLRVAKCYSGSIDGDWGSGSRAALARFNKLNKTNYIAAPPTLNVIEEFRQRLKQAKACPDIGTRTSRRQTDQTPNNGSRSSSSRRKNNQRAKSRTARSSKSASSRGKRRPGQGCRGSQCRSTATFASGRQVVITTTNDKTW